MESPSSARTFNFDEFFFSLLKVKLLQRNFHNSSFELHYIKLIFFAAASVFIHVLTALMFLVKFFQGTNMELSEVSEAGATASVFLIPFFRGIALLVNQKEVKSLLHNLEKLFPITQRDQLKHHLHGYAKTIISRNKVMQTLCTFGSVAFLAVPILKSLFDSIIRSEKYPYRYPFITWYPFEKSLLVSYPFVYCFQVIACFSAALLFFNEDLIFSTSVTQICMHYRYLSELMSQLDGKSESINCKNLKVLIRYQYALEGLCKDVDEIFSLSTFIGFTIMKIALCMFAFSLFNGIDVINMLPFIVGIMTLIVPVYLRCCNGTALYEASASLINSIYEHTWYEGTPKYRKMIVIVMIRANRPIELQASKLNHICMEYFKEVVMQTYQIFMFLYNSSA